MVIWFTGLSGAGKTTLSHKLYLALQQQNKPVFLLDGDVLRTGLNADLGFSETDRMENIRRSAEVAKFISNQNQIVICSFITPLESMRKLAREIIGEKKYIEIFVDCSLQACEIRDVKGLYKKARLNEIQNFTGISAIFEKPQNPSLIIDTEKIEIEKCFKVLHDFVMQDLKNQNI